MNLTSVRRSVLAGTAGLLLLATGCGPAARIEALPLGDAARGRYLVEGIGLCIDCHNPRNEKGEFVKERWLQGAPIPFTPTVPMPWAPVSPAIAGLPTLDDEAAVHFLRTGELPGGRLVRPPMPPYRMNEQDARDVVAHLRSLQPAKTN